MFRLLALLSLLFLAGVSRSEPAIAIVLDDMGNDYVRGKEALMLPGQVTYAFLPYSPYAKKLAIQASQLAKETMVHVPMQSLDGRTLDPGGLTTGMSAEALRETVNLDIDAVPFAAGINNHMGSLLTADEAAMTQLMQILSVRGEMYFLDSRTHDLTIAESVAKKNGIPATRRNLFLDNIRDVTHIEAQFRNLIDQARQNGTAVAIGHPYPETLSVLQQLLPQLDAYGIRLLRVSELIAQQNHTNQTIVKFEQDKHVETEVITKNVTRTDPPGRGL